MILTVTMNPSVDTRYQLDELIIDDVNPVSYTHLTLPTKLEV